MSEIPRETERQASPFLPIVMKEQLSVILRANESGWLDDKDPLFQMASNMQEEVFSEDKQPSPEDVTDNATRLLTEVWYRVVTDDDFSERGPIPDTAIELRNTLNPSWPGDDGWLPEELKIRLERFHSSE